MGFAIKMVPGVSEGILRAEHKSVKIFPTRQAFEKRRLKTLKIVELNTDVLEPMLLSEIVSSPILFKMSPKHVPLK